MRGEPNTDITLTVVREGEANPLEFVITRAVIKITSVKGEMIEPGYAYVRVSQFQAGTADALRRKLSKLKQSVDGELKGLILDLRNKRGELDRLEIRAPRAGRIQQWYGLEGSDTVKEGDQLFVIVPAPRCIFLVHQYLSHAIR